MPPFTTVPRSAFNAAGFIATSTSAWSPGVVMSLEANWIWKAETPCTVPAGARISAGKSGRVARSLPRTAVALVNRSPVSCIPSPESPANRMTTRSLSSTVLAMMLARAGVRSLLAAQRTAAGGLRRAGACRFRCHADSTAWCERSRDLGDRLRGVGSGRERLGAERVRGGDRGSDPRRARRGHRLDRHGRGLRPRRLRDPRRPGRRRAPRPGRPRHQGRSRARGHGLSPRTGARRRRRLAPASGHRPDRPLPAALGRRAGVPVEETWGAMAGLQDAGLVRWLGVSNLEPEAIERCEPIRHVDSLQPEFSMLDRRPPTRSAGVRREAPGS